MTTATRSIPEQGQLVSVRSRQWVVQHVRAGTLPPPALRPATGGPQHLVTLSSVEDDGLGEELQVVWEVEPGAWAVEKIALPTADGFDPTGDARRLPRRCAVGGGVKRRRADGPGPVPVRH